MVADLNVGARRAPVRGSDARTRTPRRTSSSRGMLPHRVHPRSALAHAALLRRRHSCAVNGDIDASDEIIRARHGGAAERSVLPVLARDERVRCTGRTSIARLISSTSPRRFPAHPRGTARRPRACSTRNGRTNLALRYLSDQIEKSTDEVVARGALSRKYQRRAPRLLLGRAHAARADLRNSIFQRSLAKPEDLSEPSGGSPPEAGAAQGREASRPSRMGSVLDSSNFPRPARVIGASAAPSAPLRRTTARGAAAPAPALGSRAGAVIACRSSSARELARGPAGTIRLALARLSRTPGVTVLASQSRVGESAGRGCGPSSVRECRRARFLGRRCALVGYASHAGDRGGLGRRAGHARWADRANRLSTCLAADAYVDDPALRLSASAPGRTPVRARSGGRGPRPTGSWTPVDPGPRGGLPKRPRRRRRA
jgi:hypothetical protein